LKPETLTNNFRDAFCQGRAYPNPSESKLYESGRKKVAIVSGAASGPGLADAEVLAREGAAVILSDVNETAGEAAAESIRAAGGKAEFMVHDVTAPGNSNDNRHPLPDVRL
jgi:NAD(P)-dependent dehydrogenase (short-subunit alcohol dehydrogenase family)